MRKWLVILILLVGNLPMFAGEEKGGLGERREVVYRILRTKSVLAYGDW